MRISVFFTLMDISALAASYGSTTENCTLDLRPGTNDKGATILIYPKYYIK